MMGVRVEKRMLLHVPWTFLGATLLISIIGIYNLASASRAPATPLWGPQAMYLGVSLLAALLVALLDYRVIQQLAVPVYVLNLVGLIALKFFGHTAKGAESWFVLGPLRLQPAEFTKLGLVLMLAKYFHDDYRPGPQGHYGFVRLVAPLGLALVPIVIVLKQPDLGTALMMTFTAGTMILFARVKGVVLVAVGLVGVLSSVVLWNDWIRVQPEPRTTFIRQRLEKHQDARIATWLDPSLDPKGRSYHALQSRIAVGSGGMLGKGWRQGTQTSLRYLPEQHTDFIFSVFAEEQGFLPCLGLLVLFGTLLLAALAVAFTARDRYGAFIAVGIASMIFWQVFENIGMVTGLLPITGITLPLMSYGGSSLLSVMLGIGLVINIGMRRHIF